MTLPPDPENMNDKRAAWAQIALNAFGDETGSYVLRDLLCDLMHWADRSDVDFQRELNVARNLFYRPETGNEFAMPEHLKWKALGGFVDAGVDDLVTLTVTLHPEPDGSGITITTKEIPGLMTCGDNLRDVFEMFADAIDGYMEVSAQEIA